MVLDWSPGMNSCQVVEAKVADAPDPLAPAPLLLPPDGEPRTDAASELLRTQILDELPARLVNGQTSQGGIKSFLKVSQHLKNVDSLEMIPAATLSQRCFSILAQVVPHCAKF